MCEKHSYYKDGRKVDSQVEQCSKAARHGPNTICEDPVKFRHPDGETPRRSSQYLSPGFPPSPPSSDASFAPSSDGERSHKRRSGTYINGEKISRSGSRREKRSSAHVTFVEPSTSPRSPLNYDTPASSPSRSPTYTYHTSTSSAYPSHDQSHYRHPEVRMEVNRPRRNSTAQYEQSTSKSKTSSSSSSSEEERLRQQLKREERKNEETKRQLAEAKRQAEEAERRADAERKVRKDAERERKLEKDIKRQNAAIDSRPPVVQSTAAPVYRRGSVSIKQQNTAPIADPYVSHKYYEREERRRRKEEEEQQQQARLRARLTPHTAPRGYDRPTVVYHGRDTY
ncbi:hypothetical protein PFICI_12319 [Pestalotiopsis fici W106-1]|uniref:Uncharacterized protein n=1 Tax=Pestalotiopsis fici (strain W106-1 / CGMCC3.15140) TaxID=1229662 RepID=W3WN81_PESFW|nr:uncharacterized protein PFICI_12319 [Pestalotiopsis fici W106-1]ETS75375.1 hypothetical protein PFICI_12319 [Pestalotiopsis fici W106-1]